MGVLNDFEAVGYGIPVLQPSDVVTINSAPVVPEAPVVVMGPGTGLGAAQLVWDEGYKGYKVIELIVGCMLLLDACRLLNPKSSQQYRLPDTW